MHLCMLHVTVGSDRSILFHCIRYQRRADAIQRLSHQVEVAQLGYFGSSQLSTTFTHLIPDLCATPSPPLPVVIERGCISIPLQQDRALEESLQLCSKLDFSRNWQRYIDLLGLDVLIWVPEQAGPLTMESVHSPFGSITVVLSRSASLAPPAIANLWVYSLMRCSPPSHSRKSSAGLNGCWGAFGFLKIERLTSGDTQPRNPIHSRCVLRTVNITGALGSRSITYTRKAPQSSSAR